MIRTKIVVEVSNIEIDDKYYSFDFKLFINGKLNKKDRYSDSHSRRDDIDDFKKDLEVGYAAQCAVEQVDWEVLRQL